MKRAGIWFKVGRMLYGATILLGSNNGHYYMPSNKCEHLSKNHSLRSWFANCLWQAMFNCVKDKENRY